MLWREQHPKGHEQVSLNFSALSAPATNVMLFEEMQGCTVQRPSRKKLAIKLKVTAERGYFMVAGILNVPSRAVLGLGP